jgi:hypothetical protein
VTYEDFIEDRVGPTLILGTCKSQPVIGETETTREHAIWAALERVTDQNDSSSAAWPGDGQCQGQSLGAMSEPDGYQLAVVESYSSAWFALDTTSAVDRAVAPRSGRPA